MIKFTKYTIALFVTFVIGIVIYKFIVGNYLQNNIIGGSFSILLFVLGVAWFFKLFIFGDRK